MNKLNAIVEEYSSGKLDKWKYIDKMYEIHSVLFEYATFIKDKNISSIEISDDKIIMTFRDSGVKFLCAINDKRLAPFDTLNFGNYEMDELKMQLNLIEEGFNVFDIGGNFGWYALHIAKNRPLSNIYSFEPILSTFRYLNNNIELNNLKNIHSFNFGFSEADGSFEFYYDPSLSVNASLANVADKKEIAKTTCIVKKLDTFMLNNSGPVDFIKCDVEGAELLVFKGATETIKRDKPIVFSEMLRKWTSKFNYHPNEIISFFKAMDYNCFTLNDNCLQPFEFVDDSTLETNYFFLHREKHFAQILKYSKQNDN
jgi:FkbM family methyltransferase